MTCPFSLSFRTLVLSASLLLPLGAVPGCLFDSSECDLGQYHCAGQEIQDCELPCTEPGCGNRWTDKVQCSASCVEPHEGEALCALSSNTDDRCRGVEGYCRDAVIVHCSGDYASSETDCASADKTCVKLDEGAPFCAASDQPDQRCPSANATASATDVQTFEDVCDGKSLLSCQRGFLVNTQVCSVACVSLSSGVSFCATSSDPDPRCDPTSPMRGDFCVDDLIASCASGYAAEIAACASGLSCGDSATTGLPVCL